MVRYNFLDSQRQAVILSENDIQIHVSVLIAKLFWNIDFNIDQIESEHRNAPNQSNGIVWPTDPADAITLRFNHPTSHVRGSGVQPEPPAGPEKYT